MRNSARYREVLAKFGSPPDQKLSSASNSKLSKPTRHRPKQIQTKQLSFFMMVVLIYFFGSTFQNDQGANSLRGFVQAQNVFLEGLGYREQALQVPKGALFQSEDPTGISFASFAGDLNIFIKGAGFTMNAQDNQIRLTCIENPSIIVFPLILSEDDVFNSHPALGILSYRVPSLYSLLGLTQDKVSMFNSLSFILDVVLNDESEAVLGCSNQRLCTINFVRTFSPIIHYISPPVTYFESVTQIVFDPQQVPSKIINLTTDSKPFVNVKIAGELIDFEFLVDETTVYQQWALNYARGVTGAAPIGKNQNITMNWEVGASLIETVESVTCDINNMNCYQAKTVPAIFDMSARQGFTTGGQNLTVYGQGFDRPNLTASVDGQNCVITQASATQFSCIVNPSASVSSINVTQPGGYGAKRRIFNASTTWIDLTQMRKMNPQEEHLHTNFELPSNIGDFYGSSLTAFFIPPLTTRYKFYVACDDQCDFTIGLDPANPSNQTKLLTVYSSAGRKRNFWSPYNNQTRITDWISLTANQSYFIQAYLAEWSGEDYLTVGVEIEQSQVKNHINSMKEVQYLEVLPDIIKDTVSLTVTVTNTTTGSFQLGFTNKANGFQLSGSIPIRATANQVRDAVWGYYTTFVGCQVDVNLTMYDSSGKLTTNSKDATVFNYYILAAKLLPAVSSTAVSVSKSTTANIIVTSPSQTSVQSTPLSGKFQIQCVDSTGFSLLTYELSYNAWVETIRKAIDDSCPMFTNKVQVMQLADGDFRYRENAIGLQILFTGYNDKPGQFKIVSGNLTSLKADNIIITNNVSYPKSDNIFYPAIPFEFLRTVETKPQLKVSVGELPAVCHNLTCDYTYIQPTGSISSFSFDENTKQLTILGIGLPNSTDLIQSIEYAKSLCEPTSFSDTQIICTLIQSPTCGSFNPWFISNMGQIPLNQGVSNQTVSCVQITSIVPAQSINLLGGDNLTLSAINFPVILKYSDVSITFNDSQNTQCIPQSSNSTSLVCLTNAFDILSAGQTVIPSIKINNIAVDNAISLTLRDKTQIITSLTPSSASPVLKSQIVIQLPTDFPYTVQRQDFSANATNQTNPSYIRYMNVIGANDTTKTITVMFGGAWSGKYNVWIRHAQEGLLDTRQIILDVSGTVTSVSPQQGSIYGGTLLTIQGSNFGNAITDNPIQLQMAEGGVGNLDCFVQTTNSTTITCLLDQTATTTGKKVNVLAFLKTSEEAKCLGDCSFTFTDVVPTVTSIQTNWDASSNQYQVTISGSSFSLGSTSDTKFQVNGITQPLISMTDSLALFAIQNISGSFNSNLHLYLSQGFPTGENQIIASNNFTLSPKIVSITPNTGSIGGTILLANIQGVGPADNGNLQLKLANGTSICSKVTIISYGQVICRTVAKEIPAGSAISVQLGTSTFTCANSDLTQCVFQQLKSDSTMPQISAATLAAGSITFTGTNFPTSGYNTKTIFSGVQADSVIVSSPDSAVATWNLGVPLTNIATLPELRFESQTNLGSALIANPNNITLTNQLTISQSNAASLSCSFAGGCNLQIQANGLSTVLQGAPQNNSIQVCGVNCNFSAIQSSASTAVCKLSAVSTLYSNQNFNISTQNPDLRPTTIWGNMKNVSAIFDGNNLNSLVVIGQSAKQCIIGASFKEGQVAYLSQVKLFQNAKVYITTFNNGQLKLQGSSDNSTWIDLWQADNNYHEGSNYITFTDPNSMPNYRFYRILGENWGSCGQSEIKFTGVETVPDSSSAYKCPVKVILGSTNITLSDQVTFDGSITPLLTAVNPRYGTVTGGDSVTFTGVGFSSNIADYTVTLDGINCPVTAATSTSVICTTGKRPGLIPTSTVIYIAGKGLVSTQGLVFTYANFWSNDKTWGGEFSPMEGETVYIPAGLNLLVDIDQTPKLNTVLVEGAIIFLPHPTNPNHQRNFDAMNIFVLNGRFEAGTEQFPYTSKLTITMHGNASDPYIPIYGNKVIGVRYGSIDLHGIPKVPTWTVLDKTAEQNDTQVTLSQSVNWQVGDLIAIAATSYNGREGEQRTIVAIDNSNPNKPILKLDSPLDFKHFAKIEQYGSEFIDMRAEIGCLTRNVKYRGDPETSANNQYGAVFFFHSPGDESLTARLENIEMQDVGQAFKVGRYAVHFHMIGTVQNSYARFNAIHQSYNRAFTMHGTSYLRLSENVVFEAMGHNFFIEDAAETKNYMYKNLVMKVMRSNSLLNTDQSPAGFWITHPDNNFIGNHVGGSDRYAYWYDLQDHSTGPNANINVCPKHAIVGEFRDNHAHSCGRYGLRIFHGMAPRLYPCMDMIYDPNNVTDPYWQNPPITANFYNLTSWKNGRNGAIAERMGDVRFNQFKVSDNLLAGIEFSLTHEYGDNMAQINDCLINGRSSNTDEFIDGSFPRGVITARTENFLVQNTRFFNFNFNEAAAFGTCSHCFHPAATDSGARTTSLKNLTLDATVTRYINYQEPWVEILHDLDGSFTKLGPNSWATPYYGHHNVKECQYRKEYDGVICDGTAQVRRIAISNYLPKGILTGMRMKILPYDDDLLNSPGFNKTAYILNRTNYGAIKFRPLQMPSMSWAVPFVTGHKYKFSFGEAGIDWLQLQFDMSERWEQTDKPIYFVHNFTDVRARVNLTVFDPKALGGSYMPFRENNSIPASTADYQLGQNILYTDQSVRELHFIVSPKNTSISPWEETQVLIKMDQCVGPCNADINENVPLENFTRFWSNASHWPNNTIPKANDTVEILPGWNMVFDLTDSPIYKLVIVNGNLTFKNDSDVHLNCKHIFVRAGILRIGSEDYPFTKKATITLYGTRNEETIVYDNAIEAGSKVLANINKVFMYGIKRKQTLMRLRSEVYQNDTQILIDTGLDLVQGDRLALLPTSYASDARDDVFVKSYDASTGLVTLNTSLSYYHFGAASSTASKYSGVDIRGEVLLLTRNVLIEGKDEEAWGCQIVTSDTVEIYNNTMKPRYGQMFLDSVEIKNCSQRDTYKAAVRFDSVSTLWSQVSNCAIHNGIGWGVSIINSENVVFFNNMIFAFSPIGFGVQSSKNITVDQNVFGYQTIRTGFFGQNLVDKEGGFSICAYDEKDKCSNIRVRNNIAAGTTYAGFVLGVGYKCGEENTQQVFRGNIAHSNYAPKKGEGVTFKTDNMIPEHRDCLPFSNFAAYKNAKHGVAAFQMTINMTYSNLVLIDNGYGFVQNILNVTDRDEYLDQTTTASDIIVYGETESLDCPKAGASGFCFMIEKYAMNSNGGCTVGKNAHEISSSKFPLEKFKGNTQWGLKAQINRLTLIGFKSKTRDGKDSAVFGINHYASDFIPIHQFSNTKFIDVNDDALANFYDPPQEWANPDDCMQWPCSAPLNVLYSFKDSVFEGNSPSWLNKNFQLIANNLNISSYIPDCQIGGNQRFYICQQKQGLGILMFDSLDEDKLDRSSQPIIYKKQGTYIANYLNAFMDHVWDGFYTGQKRLQRFPGLVWSPQKSIYDIIMTGTPPKNLRIKLISEDPSASMMVRIAYPSADSRQVVLNGQRVPMNEWDDRIRNYGEIKFTTCGENRYIGVKNILEFYLTSGCVLDIQPRNAIQTMVRMEWTIDAFFKSGGTTTFMDRLAGSLGIHASNIKMVSVYQGSLVINYAITQDDNNKEALAQILQTQNSLYATNALNLGAPILDVQTTVNVASTNTNEDQRPQSIVTNGVVTAPGFQPIVITQVQNNKANSAQFVPNLTVSQSNQTIYNDILIKQEKQVITVQQQQQQQQQQTLIGQVELYTKTASWVYIIVGVFVVIVLIVIGLIIRYFRNKQTADLVIAQKYSERRLDQGFTDVKLKTNVANDGKVLAQDSKIQDASNQKLQGNFEMEVFEDQYDPAQDFVIFGVGDKTKGGLQSLKEKMNLADGVNSQDNESSEEEGNQVQKQLKVPSGTDYENSEQYNSIQGSVRSDNQMIVSSSRRVQSEDNVIGEKKINYDLPENQEIKEEEEEEEEEEE